MMYLTPTDVAQALIEAHGFGALSAALGMFDDAPPEEAPFYLEVCKLLDEAETLAREVIGKPVN